MTDPSGHAPLGPRGGIEIACSDLGFTYPDGTVALRDVDLRIGPGEAVAIIGQNGSGKSSLVRHFNGLLRASRGEVRVGGQAVGRRHVAELARQVALAFQNPDRQIFSGRVRDEVAFGARNAGLAGERLAERVGTALQQVGLEGLPDANPYDLGFSRRKLLATAGALAVGSPAIVLDEPTTGLDAGGVGRISRLVATLRERERTVIVVSHDMRFVAENLPRVIVMREGGIIFDGPTADAFAAARWPALASTHLEPPLAARVGERLGLGSTPTARRLIEAWTGADSEKGAP